MSTNISNDLVWQITPFWKHSDSSSFFGTGRQNAFLVNRNSGGGSQFSRDPLNLLNKHSFKYAGYSNNKAIGVQGTENGVVVITKKPSNPQQPAQNLVTVTYGPSSSNRKIFKGVADKTAKNGYRADLREEAVARVSAVRRSQLPKKDAPAKKLRGVQARKAAEESE
ncbi:uncharacterized protein N7515_003956 [Penicillium bovifimosum]|uniref:Ribosomal eL28/Mak16 domain-containing protein n=1 Tax=Penicillium bovifimosum TaxID=126998 RepID=A0A9W9L562_9EURO|nr:uncharacterized protein N7515_003956 [Penicillium bovifimosum]KAJ5139108.1 hypothetical protein N7515_003956 [Penicillium bovifimosum]